MDRVPCRVSTEQDRLDREQEAIEEAAEPGYISYMTNLDSDIIDAALDGLTLDEYQSLEEDCGHGPMRDAAHAGTIIINAIERYCLQMAIRDEMGRK